MFFNSVCPSCLAGAGLPGGGASLVAGGTHPRRHPDGTRPLALLFRVGLRHEPRARPQRWPHLPAAFALPRSAQPAQPRPRRRQAGGELVFSGFFFRQLVFQQSSLEKRVGSYCLFSPAAGGRSDGGGGADEEDGGAAAATGGGGVLAGGDGDPL